MEWQPSRWLSKHMGFHFPATACATAGIQNYTQFSFRHTLT